MHRCYKRKLQYNPYTDVGVIGDHWGHAGSGILYVHDEHILLLYRSPEVMHGDCWGIPGGAIPEDDVTGKMLDPLVSAFKEVREELGGFPPNGHVEPVETYIYQDPDSSFRFFTFTIELPDEAFYDWEPRLNWENTDWGWFTASEALSELELHPGVAELLERS